MKIIDFMSSAYLGVPPFAVNLQAGAACFIWAAKRLASSPCIVRNSVAKSTNHCLVSVTRHNTNRRVQNLSHIIIASWNLWNGADQFFKTDTCFPLLRLKLKKLLISISILGAENKKLLTLSQCRILVCPFCRKSADGAACLIQAAKFLGFSPQLWVSLWSTSYTKKKI